MQHPFVRPILPAKILPLVLSLLALVLVDAGGSAARAQADPAWRHAGALTGEPGYPEDFTHFDYVNPDAPKGGTVRLSDPSGFDTLNPVLSRGNPRPVSG
jgi:microcin C transport system substrate-binding protein